MKDRTIENIAVVFFVLAMFALLGYVSVQLILAI